jgi:hypothetical protein
MSGLSVTELDVNEFLQYQVKEDNRKDLHGYPLRDGYEEVFQKSE